MSALFERSRRALRLLGHLRDVDSELAGAPERCDDGVSNRNWHIRNCGESRHQRGGSAGWQPSDRGSRRPAFYLDAVLEDVDPDLLKAALGDIARAKGMTQIAHAASLGRTNLYKTLSPEGNPSS
jgi:hypothetical protein